MRVAAGLSAGSLLGTSSVPAIDGLTILISSSAILRAFWPLPPHLFYSLGAWLQFQIFINGPTDWNVIFSIIFWNMYIEPTEYLDLTDRISLLTRTNQLLLSQKVSLNTKTISQGQKIKLLQSRIAELQRQKEQQKKQLKDHVTVKTDAIISQITAVKEGEMGFVGEQIEKLRNWSAIETLKKLEERIKENRTVTFEKDFYEKVKTLYIMKKKKATCTSMELFQWVREIAELRKNGENDSTGRTNGLQGTQNSILNKSMKKSKKSQQRIESRVNIMMEDKENKPTAVTANSLKPSATEPQKQKRADTREPLKITLNINELAPEDDPLAELP